MKSVLSTLAMVALLTLTGTAQTLRSNLKHITITGNSIAQMMGGFQQHLFPTVPPNYVTIRGQYGFTCNMLLPLVTYLVPANTEIAVLIDSTNDVDTGVDLQTHYLCMQQTISALWMRNRAIKVVVALTPPQVDGNDGCPGYTDERATIQAYNDAYNGVPSSGYQGLAADFPGVVTIVDVWTPSAQSDDYAIPADMTGACGIHPGPANVWTGSWAHFSQALTTSVYEVM